MRQSLRALLDEVLDYAGLFPPDKLPLDEAIRNYARYRASPEAWMLGRFICPAARLGELAPYCEPLFTPQRPVRLSVTGSEDPLQPEVLIDLRAMHHFALGHHSQAAVEAFEVRLSPETLRQWRTEAVAEALNVLATRLVEHHFADLEVFVEPIFGDDWDGMVQRIIAALKLHDETRGVPAPARIGIKLRTGGVEAAAFPTVSQVASVIVACRDASLPLKFTAGLHHPLRHFEAGLGADMHGFLNIFVAGVLAHARGIDQPTLEAVLQERAPTAFEFTDHYVRWRNLEVTGDEIEAARGEFVLSFGSCSFDEPQEGLRRAGCL